MIVSTLVGLGAEGFSLVCPSEEKAKLLREVMAKIEAKNEVLEYVCSETALECGVFLAGVDGVGPWPVHTQQCGGLPLHRCSAFPHPS